MATAPAPHWAWSLAVAARARRYLLRALCQAASGFYFAADQATDGESLRLIGAALGEHLNSPAPLSFPDWHAVIDALLALGRDRAVPVVIDEFPYPAKANPSLPSIVQNALALLREQREASRTRLPLCGSAKSFMDSLLSGNAPLRGRAGLELLVPTLDYQLAAEFWGLSDPNTVLSPTSPLSREARYLLPDEPDMQDTGLYHSVLAAIADGYANPRRHRFLPGPQMRRPRPPPHRLEDAGLIAKEPDAFKGNRTTFQITKPLVTFHHAIMRPVWSNLEHTQDPSRLWQRSRRGFTGNVLRPYFEHTCRHWTHRTAEDTLLGDFPHRVHPPDQ